MGVALGLTVALAYGTADFLARFSTQRLGVSRVLLGVLATGSTLLTLWLLLSGARWSVVTASLGWLLLCGLLNYVMLAFLYAALRRGPIAVASPIVAVHPALVLLLLFAFGLRPRLLEWMGLVVTLLGGLGLATQLEPASAVSSQAAAHTRKTALLAGICAVALSFQILCVQKAASLAGPAAAAWGSRTFALVPAAIGFFWAKPAPRERGGGFGVTIIQGSLDVAAVVSLALGSHGGSRAIVPIIGSAFSAVTVLLARFVLRETVTTRQWLSIGVVLAGITLLGAA
jgi:drug/metabolite transporter (DMT)-like permease